MSLYVVVVTDGKGNIIGYPKGGGSSSPSFIRAFDSEASAKRSAKRINFEDNARVAKVTALELIEEDE